jgi:tetratricopeptide (TPR) repeat protein
MLRHRSRAALLATCAAAGSWLAGPGVARDLDTSAARRLFERGDYPAAEREVLKLVAGLPADAPRERALLLAQLAEVRCLQGAGEAALEDAKAALALDRSAPVLRTAVFVCFRARRYREALPHIERLLEMEPGNDAYIFSRGVARAREGRFEEALPDLARGKGSPATRREALFESALALAKLERPAEALVPLREILEEDPFDAEAVHQASRCLLRLRRPGATRLAAVLGRYFEALRGKEGESSKDQHLAFAGKAVEAARERAARWERLGRHDRALAEAEAMRRVEPEAADQWLRSFWERQGFRAAPAGAELERALAEATAAGDAIEATRIARLLLAIEPASRTALERLAAAAEDPSLIVPRLHYVSRLAVADPGEARWKEELARLRRAVEGTAR